MTTAAVVNETLSTIDEKNAGGTSILPGQTPDGEHILSCLIKRSYEIVPGEPCTRAAIDAPIYAGNEYYDGPMNSSVKYESDFIPFKSATDVVFNGCAYAPFNVPVEYLYASLAVGNIGKELYIIGDRACSFRPFLNPVFSDPEPFIKMDIRYELAFGGVDVFSNPAMQYPCPRNHLGRGFVVKNKRCSVEGLKLPNIEDPMDILHPGNICCGNIKYWQDQPIPQGLGWFLAGWYPRAGFAGVMPADRALEQELRRAYVQVVPETQRAMYEQSTLPSMDFRFFNGASQGLAAPFLKGDESLRFINLSPECDLQCWLPGDRPSVCVDVGFGEQQPELFLHTVMIRMEERRIDLTWRGSIPYPGPDWLPEMKKLEIRVK